MSATRASNPDDSTRAARVGRALDEFLQRRARGEPVNEAELLAAHPDLADDLREHLELLQSLSPKVDRIEALVAQGILTGSNDPAYLATLGPYQITDVLGRGGMGIVLKGYEERLSRAVALKILRPEFADDPAIVARFLREGRAAAALRHPHIVTVYTVGAEHGVHYLAMEYIDGPTLADVIRAPAGVGARSASEGAVASGAPPDEVAAGLRCGRDVASAPRGRRNRVAADVPSDESRSGTRANQVLTLDPNTIRHIFRQLLEALAAAHGAGLIHRDVKSSNILLDHWATEPRSHEATEPRRAHGQPQSVAREGFREGAEVQSAIPDPRTPNPEPSVKLADFGLARLLSSQTRVTLGDSVLGTPEYMSPEQARGDQDIDHRSDLYSAGVVLYEMLTGRTPFRAETPSAVIHQIINVEPADPRELNKDIDPALASLALRLMAKAREDRFSSSADALAALGARRRIALPERKRRLLRRAPFILFSLVLLTAGIWGLNQFDRNPEDRVSRHPNRGPIIRAWVVDPRDPQYAKLGTAVLVSHRNDPTDFPLYLFPPSVIRTTAATFLDGPAGQVVVAGLLRALDGRNVFAFDANGLQLMSWEVPNRQAVQKWPDCLAPVYWACSYLQTADLDGEAGDELVVVANVDGDYPACISVIDIRSWSLRSTFWHLGQFTKEVRSQRDFFGPGHAALIAQAVNNKLDGVGTPFPERPYQTAPGEDKPRTAYDKVDVLMILDPNAMEGVGPPRLSATHLQAAQRARPYAYAFLDMPRNDIDGMYVLPGEGRQLHPEARELICFDHFEILPADSTSADGAFLLVDLGRPEQRGGGAFLTLDRNLNIVEVMIRTGETIGVDDDYWRNRWRVIIQNREYVDK